MTGREGRTLAHIESLAHDKSSKGASKTSLCHFGMRIGLNPSGALRLVTLKDTNLLP